MLGEKSRWKNRRTWNLSLFTSASRIHLQKKQFSQTWSEQTVLETWSRKTCWKQGWLTQTFNLVKKKNRKEKQYLWNTIKQRATEWSVPVTVKGSFPSQALSLNYAAHHVRTWSLVTITTASSSPPCTQLIFTSHRKTYAFPRPTTTLHQGIHIWLLSCHHFLYMTAASRLCNFTVSG